MSLPPGLNVNGGLWYAFQNPGDSFNLTLRLEEHIQKKKNKSLLC